MALIQYGRVEIRVNGTLMRSLPGATASGIADYTRSSVVGDRYNGHTEAAHEARCEFTMTAQSDTSIKEIANITDGTITFESAGGTGVFVMRNAVSTGEATITSGEGEVSFAFFGPEWEPVS